MKKTSDILREALLYQKVPTFLQNFPPDAVPPSCQVSIIRFALDKTHLKTLKSVKKIMSQ